MVVYDEVPKTVSYQINIGKVYKIYAFVFLYFQILQITSTGIVEHVCVELIFV